MTKKLFLLSCIAVVLIIGGCSKESPVAPQVSVDNGGEATLSKHKAEVSHVSATFDFNQGQIVDRGREWVDEQGGYHVSGQVYENSPITGDLAGVDEHNVFNMDISAIGEGRSWGHTRSQVTWADRNISGVWLGVYENRIVAGQMQGHSSWIGRGGFAGMTAKGTQETEPGNFLLLHVNFTIKEKD